MVKRYTLLLFIFLFTGIFTGYAQVDLVYPLGDERLEPGEDITIEWELVQDHGECAWELYFSPNGGEDWDTLTTALEKSNTTYKWTVPEISTDKGIIRVVQNNVHYENLAAESNNIKIGDIKPMGLAHIPQKPIQIGSIYPNPVQSTAFISFEVERPVEVDISIYNVLGRRIKTLTHKKYQAGSYELQWNASNVPDGIYFCRVSAGERVVTRRLVRDD